MLAEGVAGTAGANAIQLLNTKTDDKVLLITLVPKKPEGTTQFLYANISKVRLGLGDSLTVDSK